MNLAHDDSTWLKLSFDIKKERCYLTLSHKSRLRGHDDFILKLLRVNGHELIDYLVNQCGKYRDNWKRATQESKEYKKQWDITNKEIVKDDVNELKEMNNVLMNLECNPIS